MSDSWDWRRLPADRDWQAAISERGARLCREALDAALAKLKEQAAAGSDTVGL